jgi:CRP/FNR family transcriptional regulator, cyclic AMP receptor protein
MSDASVSSVSQKWIAKLAEMGQTRTYKKHDILITEGEKSDALFLLVSGQLKVFTRDASGREIVYNIVKPGEMLGEMFLDGGARSASVRAMGECQCVVFEEGQIHELTRKDPEFAESLIQLLIGRLRHATNMIKSLVLSDVYGRTTTLLNQLSVIEGNARVVPLDLTQQEIANRVGATREMVNQVIGKLIKDGVVSRDHHRRLVFVGHLPTSG